MRSRKGRSMAERTNTFIEFSDYPRNGEGVSFYEPDADAYLYPDDAKLIVHVNDAAAYLNHDDIVKLRDKLTEHLGDVPRPQCPCFAPGRMPIVSPDCTLPHAMPVNAIKTMIEVPMSDDEQPCANCGQYGHPRYMCLLPTKRPEQVICDDPPCYYCQRDGKACFHDGRGQR